MTARAPNPDSVLAAFDALPMSGEPLTPEQEADVARLEHDIGAGKRGRSHEEIERALEARRRAEGG